MTKETWQNLSFDSTCTDLFDMALDQKIWRQGFAEGFLVPTLALGTSADISYSTDRRYFSHVFPSLRRLRYFSSTGEVYLAVEVPGN